MMTRFFRPFTIFVIFVIVVTACTLNTTNENYTAARNLTLVAAVELTVQADTSVPFDTVGQVIAYRFNVRNSGEAALPGPVTINGITATCPAVNTVGNLNNDLDAGETLVCTAARPITQADLDTGSVTIVATAAVGSITSSPVTTTIATIPSKRLSLTKSANPQTYDSAGQVITYTYTIKNSGSMSLGPAQFTVTDAGLPAPVNCGDANKTLVPNDTVTCTATYAITQADLGQASIATNATASGGGAPASQPASATVTKTVVSQPSPSPATTLTPGSSIQHKVVAGEWLWQIARCYGVNPTKLIQANTQLADPAKLTPDMILTVPNIGSASTAYGPPCVVNHTVQSGDTWNSIAQKYNADVTVLQMVNTVTLANGAVLKVPRNSAGAGVVVTPASNLTRINFPAGSTTATQTGSVRAGNQAAKYVVAGTQGQVLNVKVTANANAASLAIYSPNGGTLKTPDLTPTWSGTLPANGDYRIDISNALGQGAPDVSFTLEVTLKDYCVDTSRNINPIGPTHFNICGLLDPSGKLLVTKLHLFQRPEDVGQGGLTQDIVLASPSLTPLNDPNSLVVEDMNADGYADFRLMNSRPNVPVTYLYFYYNPGTFQFVFNGER